MYDYPIDIVIPWVDGSDPEWRREKEKYNPTNGSDANEARYRVWDTFKYWFRCVEENAPWIRKIHFLTVGHVPDWLDISNEKIHIVRHKDFIPEKYLPTFSSHTIELNMHRIPDLADHFIYFNDDVYLTQKVEKSDFFDNGIPKDSAILGVIKNTDVNNYMPYIMLNMMGLINKNFKKRQVMKHNLGKWFSPKYGRNNFYNIILSPWNEFTGFRNFHTCVPYLKSTLEDVWKKFPKELDETCLHKFRSREDVNQYLFRYWQLVNGKFVPMRPNSVYITIGRNEQDDLEKVLSNNRFKIVCVNDDPIEFDFEKEQRKIDAIFSHFYPFKSKFEK